MKNIDIIDFYPLVKMGENFTGTLRVKIIELRLEILGVYVKKKDGQFQFFLPFKKAIDHKTKKKIFFPLLNFLDKELKEKIMDEIAIKGPGFINNRLKCEINPIVFKEMQEVKKEREINVKEKNAMPNNGIAHKKWVDPKPLHKKR